jgi:hypothetical protein
LQVQATISSSCWSCQKGFVRSSDCSSLLYELVQWSIKNKMQRQRWLFKIWADKLLRCISIVRPSPPGRIGGQSKRILLGGQNTDSSAIYTHQQRILVNWIDTVKNTMTLVATERNKRCWCSKKWFMLFCTSS